MGVFRTKAEKFETQHTLPIKMMLNLVLFASLSIICHHGKVDGKTVSSYRLNSVTGKFTNSAKSLVGFTVVKESTINVMKYALPDLSPHLWIENVTTVDTKGLTPTFSSAYCPSTGIFAIAINDKNSPRVAWMNLFERKFLGLVIVNAILIDNLECDDYEKKAIAYAFQIGKKHNLIQIDFATFSIYKLMSSSYKSYGGSAIDPANKRFFTVAVTPAFDTFNYSLSIMEYGSNREVQTPPFKEYGIGALVYNANLSLPLAFVQTPAEIPAVNYKCYLAVLNIVKGKNERI